MVILQIAKRNERGEGVGAVGQVRRKKKQTSMWEPGRVLVLERCRGFPSLAASDATVSSSSFPFKTHHLCENHL